MEVESIEETKRCAGLVAEDIKTAQTGNHALVYGLAGGLGSGKTTFVKFLAKELGVAKEITSPSFLIIRNYKTALDNFPNLVHIDAYRLKNSKELAKLGFEKLINNPENLVIVEWADNVKEIMPNHSRWLQFEHGEKESERIIRGY